MEPHSDRLWLVRAVETSQGLFWFKLNSNLHSSIVIHSIPICWVDTYFVSSTDYFVERKHDANRIQQISWFTLDSMKASPLGTRDAQSQHGKNSDTSPSARIFQARSSLQPPLTEHHHTTDVMHMPPCRPSSQDGWGDRYCVRCKFNSSLFSRLHARPVVYPFSPDFLRGFPFMRS
jgi:hypothetical protein